MVTFELAASAVMKIVFAGVLLQLGSILLPWLRYDLLPWLSAVMWNDGCDLPAEQDDENKERMQDV